jgi:membrane fusion protein (multidrug efflux system)
MKTMAFISLLLLLTTCAKEVPPVVPPPPEVKVITVQAAPIRNVFEVPGRLEAVRSAEVRARVDGIIEKRLYQEGTDVHEGQPLFSIDPRELQTQLSAAQAMLARAQTTSKNATLDIARSQALFSKELISQQEHDAVVARLNIAKADVAQAKATVDAARLSLSYAEVTAPISGRAGRSQVTEGALVSAGAATLLTVIEQTDPIYANFSQSSSQVLEIQKELASTGRVVAHLVLEDGSVYPTEGELNFVDLRLDESTGMAALRAEFPNSNQSLLPGQFVRVRIEAGEKTGILVPQRAVVITPQGATVMVVGENNVANSRPVTLGPLQGDLWVILSGLSSGDRLIVDGLQKVQPGKPVKEEAL